MIFDIQLNMKNDSMYMYKLIASIKIKFNNNKYIKKVASQYTKPVSSS